jgi:hypothetical protein
MNPRLVNWIVGGALLVAVAAVLFATLEPFEGRSAPVFIAGDRPVTEDQIRQKLQSEGYSNLQVVRQGRYFEATGSKDGATGRIIVDSQTGRLRGGGDDDDD